MARIEQDLNNFLRPCRPEVLFEAPNILINIKTGCIESACNHGYQNSPQVCYNNVLRPRCGEVHGGYLLAGFKLHVSKFDWHRAKTTPGGFVTPCLPLNCAVN
jgi:hypothetical protein